MLGIGEKFFDIIVALFRSIFDTLMAPFKDLRSLEDLIYGIGGDGKDLLYNTFTAAEIENVIVPGVSTLSFLVGFFLILGIIVSGTKLSTSAMNPANRTSMIEMLRDWILVAIVLWNIGFLYEMMFTFNKFIVEVFSSSYKTDLNETIGPKLTGDSFFGWALVMIVIVGLAIWANFYYLMRKLTLMILMILGPVFLSLWMFDSTKRVTLSWGREMFGTIMVQSVHAMVFWVIGTIADGMTKAGDVGFIELTMLYVVIIPAGEAIRSLLNLGGDMNNSLRGFAAQSGLSALNNVVGSVKNAVSSGNGHNNSSGVKVKNQNGAQSGAKANAAANAGISNSKTERMIRRGDITSRLGKGVLGAAGAIAGAPMGDKASKMMSSVGQEMGAVGGGIAGRSSSALVDAASKATHHGIAGLKGAKGNIQDAAEQESLARELGQIHTADWARQNEEDEKSRIRAENPQLDEAGVQDKWNAIVGQKHGEFTKKAREDLKSGLYTSGELARANVLANQLASDYTNAFANNGEKKSNFIQESMNKGMNSQEAEEAWAQEVEQVGDSARVAARSVASEMTNGKPLDSFIKSEDFADRFVQNRLEAEKGQYLDNFMKEHPNVSATDALNAWKQNEPARASEIIAQAAHSVSQTPIATLAQSGAHMAKASDLAQESAKMLTNQWANDNKENFISDLKQQGLSEMEINREWEQTLQSRFNDTMKQTTAAAMKITDGQSMSAPIDRNAFSSELGQSMISNVKEDFIRKASAQGISVDTAETQFAASGLAKGIESNVHRAVSSVPEMAMSKGFEMREAIAHQTAARLTDQWATPQQQEAFNDTFKTSYAAANNGTLPKPEQIQQAWNSKVSSMYDSHVNSVSEQISPENTKGFVMPGVGNVLKGAASGFVQGSGIQQVVQESKAAHVAGAFIDATRDGQGLRGSMQMAQTAANAFVPVNAVEKAEQFQNSVSYAGAVLGGVSGYAMASKIAQKRNPYTPHVNNSTMEVADMARHAKTEMVDVGNGQTEERIAQGAIQLVVERDRSYVQVQGKDNQVKRVSAFGAGDPSLQSGQVVYQDYGIEQDTLVPRSAPGMKSGAYIKDTAGYKTPYEQPLPVSAGNLVANRRVTLNQMAEPLHDAFNQQVLNNSFSMQDFQAHSTDQKATVVVEQNRSYVAMTGENGKMFRISDFGKGDSNLSVGQTQYKEYVIENARFTDSPSDSAMVQTFEYNQKGEKVPVQNSRIENFINPNEFISYTPNQRLKKRQELENKRFKQGVV